MCYRFAQESCLGEKCDICSHNIRQVVQLRLGSDVQDNSERFHKSGNVQRKRSENLLFNIAYKRPNNKITRPMERANSESCLWTMNFLCCCQNFLVVARDDGSVEWEKIDWEKTGKVHMGDINLSNWSH